MVTGIQIIWRPILIHSSLRWLKDYGQSIQISFSLVSVGVVSCSSIDKLFLQDRVSFLDFLDFQWLCQQLWVKDYTMMVVLKNVLQLRPVLVSKAGMKNRENSFRKELFWCSLQRLMCYQCQLISTAKVLGLPLILYSLCQTYPWHLWVSLKAKFTRLVKSPQCSNKSNLASVLEIQMNLEEQIVRSWKHWRMVKKQQMLRLIRTLTHLQFQSKEEVYQRYEVESISHRTMLRHKKVKY